MERRHGRGAAGAHRRVVCDPQAVRLAGLLARRTDDAGADAGALRCAVLHCDARRGDGQLAIAGGRASGHAGSDQALSQREQRSLARRGRQRHGAVSRRPHRKYARRRLWSALARAAQRPRGFVPRPLRALDAQRRCGGPGYARPSCGAASTRCGDGHAARGVRSRGRAPLLRRPRRFAYDDRDAPPRGVGRHLRGVPTVLAPRRIDVAADGVAHRPARARKSERRDE